MSNIRTALIFLYVVSLIALFVFGNSSSKIRPAQAQSIVRQIIGNNDPALVPNRGSSSSHTKRRRKNVADCYGPKALSLELRALVSPIWLPMASVQPREPLAGL